LLLSISCKHKNKHSVEVTQQVSDGHTQSNAYNIAVKHLDLNIKVNFENRQISGCALWTIDNKSKAIDSLILDTDDLGIDSVFVDGKKSSFRIGTFVEHLGKPLIIPVQKASKQVMICYKTGKHPRALQWLTPEQTGGNAHMFLYTQSESIYARSWIPCPDGPGIRFTYNARVEVPHDLLALMSAENPQQMNDSGVYHFKMDIPIPAYLMALAVGDIRFRSIDQRTGVYALPEMIDKAAKELEDVGKMVSKAEELYGPYRWGRYDVLILPPGFPIGGMENPKLTFATPTILAGDKSLVNLIAHELAHNWSGNLVTNATWNDFWLNEGFTVYFERRLTEAMHDKNYADMLWELGYQDLEHTVDELGKESYDTHLKLNLSGRDPDDGLTDIAYEKGALFLKMVENEVGRPTLDSFLRNYFNTHAFHSISTEEFLEYFYEHLIKSNPELEDKLHINEWIYGPGIPSNAPRVDRVRFIKVRKAVEQVANGISTRDLSTEEWTTNEWLLFLRSLPKPLPLDKMKLLDDGFHFSNSGNCEIADLWYINSIAADYQPAYPAIDKFLSRVGRRKFIEPLYAEMMKTGKQDMAKTIYAKYRENYHPLAQMTLDKLVLGKK
jgi:aminopeptidase N